MAQMISENNIAVYDKIIMTIIELVDQCHLKITTLYNRLNLF